MVVRCVPENKSTFPRGLVWEEKEGKNGPCSEAVCDAQYLEKSGFTLHWTHERWRMAKIHTEHGWKQVGCGRDGNYFAIILARRK